MTIDSMLRHEQTVAILYRRLANHPEVHTNIFIHLPYFYDRRGNGEADVVSETNGGLRYYEVKGHYHPNNFAKAKIQFANFKKAYPNTDVKFIYVSPERVRRVYL
jgi:hypothetical protein